MKYKEIVAPYDMHVQSVDGAHGHFLKKGEPTLVNESIFHAALVRGCAIPGGMPGTEELDENIVEQLVNAMKLFIAAGDPDQLMKTTGEPRAAALRGIVPNFTKEQREDAWAIVQGDEPEHEESESALVMNDD